MDGSMTVPIVGGACLVLVALSESADKYPWLNWVILAIIVPPLAYMASCMCQGPPPDKTIDDWAKYDEPTPGLRGGG